jgi:hypothetical protein
MQTESMGETTTAPARAKRPRGGNGRFRRTIEHVDRDVQAATMHCQGATLAQITTALGYSDTGSASRGVQKALYERGRTEELTQAREARLLELDELRAKMWEIVNSPPPLTDRVGRVVTNPATGNPVPNVEAAVNAASVLVRLSERTARIVGLDAPRRSHTTIEGLLATLRPADFQALAEARIKQLRAELGMAGVEVALEDGQPVLVGTVEST